MLQPTVVTSKKEDVDELKTKNAQKVPADARHPPRVHVLGHDTSLQHTLELDGNGEGKFHYVAWLGKKNNRPKPSGHQLWRVAAYL